MALTDYVIMPASDYKNMCDAIREKTGKTASIKSGELVDEFTIAVGNGGGGGGVSTEPYIEYTLNSSNSPIAAKLYNFTSIPTGCFAYMTSLTSIDLSNSPNITSIGDSAFRNCTSLTEFIVPDSVTSIGVNAFYNCTNLASITIANGVKSIPNYAFYGCSKLEDVIFSDTITSIGSYAFYNCSVLENVVLPETVTSISNYAFYNCKKFTSFNIHSFPPCLHCPVLILTHSILHGFR